MEYVFVLVGIIVAAAGGFFAGRNYSSDSLEKGRLESELKEKQAELDAFRNKVTGHFEKTAELFNQVSDSYQSLYDHMANSSNQLCASPSFRSLPKSNENAIDDKPNSTHKTNNDASNLFDADKLYKAHNYRTGSETKPKDVVVEQTANKGKVVDIETAKEDKNEPALDYAVKKNGVINHNSLDIDGVKTS